MYLVYYTVAPICVQHWIITWIFKFCQNLDFVGGGVPIFSSQWQIENFSVRIRIVYNIYWCLVEWKIKKKPAAGEKFRKLHGFEQFLSTFPAILFWLSFKQWKYWRGWCHIIGVLGGYIPHPHRIVTTVTIERYRAIFYSSIIAVS